MINKTRNILVAISVFFLVLAILGGGFDYGFFILVRLVVSGTTAYLAWKAHETDQERWVWVFGAGAVIFNPFLPLALGRDIWVLADLLTIVILIVYVSRFKGFKANEHDKKEKEYFNHSVLANLPDEYIAGAQSLDEKRESLANQLMLHMAGLAGEIYDIPDFKTALNSFGLGEEHSGHILMELTIYNLFLGTRWISTGYQNNPRELLDRVYYLYGMEMSNNDKKKYFDFLDSLDRRYMDYDKASSNENGAGPGYWVPYECLKYILGRDNADNTDARHSLSVTTSLCIAMKWVKETVEKLVKEESGVEGEHYPLEDVAADGMAKWIGYEFKNFEDSTGDFTKFAQDFRRHLKRIIPRDKGWELVSLTWGCSEVRGFIRVGDKFVCFNTKDVRGGWNGRILIRMAKNENDYTGGPIAVGGIRLEGLIYGIERLMSPTNPEDLVLMAKREEEIRRWLHHQ